MTDKPNKIEKWAGCDLNDKRPRMAGSQYGGKKFQVSPTDGLNPAPGADGKKVSGTSNLKNEH